MADPRTELEAALFALPKPIDRDAVIAQALSILDQTRYDQFVRWFDTNGAILLGKLNG